MGNSFIKPLNFGFNPPPAFPLPYPISNHKKGANSNSNSNSNSKSMIHSHHIHIEMIGLQSKRRYTSLKDLLPDSPPCTASPTTTWKDSWREIPIKDPLLQHAAWAYLQPMGADELEEEHHRWWTRLTQSCCGCFTGLVLMVFDFRGWFSEQRSEEGLPVDNGQELVD